MTTATPGKKRGQKPVNLIAASSYSSQEVIWATVRKLKQFTSADLICHIGNKHPVNDETVKSYLSRLLKGDYLAAEKGAYKGGCCVYRYTLVKDTGIDAPRLTKDGKPSTQGLGREQLWRTMRIIGDFNYRDLVLAASTEHVQIAESEARTYIKHLHSAGYLVEIKPCERGRHPKPAVYRLLPSKFTGPKPPMVQRVKQVFDPNLNKVMYREAGGVK